MNKKLIDLIKQSGINLTPSQFSGVLEDEVDEFELEKFAELLLKEVTNLIQERWYEINDEPALPNETDREVGMRVGKKSELIRMSSVIKRHFGLEQ